MTTKAERLLPLVQAITLHDPLGKWDRETREYIPCERHPTAFIRKGENTVMVSAEDGCFFADYYDHGGMWIHPLLEKFAAENGCFWEWESPGAIGLYDL